VLRAVRNRWRRSFVASVTVLALLGVALFALVVGRIVHDQIADQAFDRAAESAEILARAGFAPRLPPPGGRLSPRDLADLDRQLGAARRREPLLDLRLWSRDGTVLYARDRRRVGRRARPPAPVARALRGDTASAVSDDDTVLRTAAPVVRRADGPVAGALELTLPYGPVADDVDRRTRRLAIALAAIALLVYVLALPALLRAARALRAQYDPRRVELVRELKRAMARGELLLHFQPIAEAATGRPRSAEALVRWKLPPDRFIPLVEGTDVMWPLTLHVLDGAAAECARWRADGHDVAVAVNVSGAVLHDRRLGREIRALLERRGLPAAALEIEVTEGAVMSDAEGAAEVLRGLTALGIGVIAIDDFGTGYSSLARLHELPLDTLKIDQSFVMRMAREGDASIVLSIVELAHALGLKVIAEGAEDEATIERLAALGCDYVQGYGLTRPLPSDEFGRWLSVASGSDRPPARA
jgi:EAL domain-containing protein (putative c-di-GMP-specific phosphodiesterase class I)